MVKKDAQPAKAVPAKPPKKAKVKVKGSPSTEPYGAGAHPRGGWASLGSETNAGL